MIYEYDNYCDGYETLDAVFKDCCKSLGIPFDSANEQILSYFSHTAWGVIERMREEVESRNTKESLQSLCVFGTVCVPAETVMSSGIDLAFLFDGKGVNEIEVGK